MIDIEYRSQVPIPPDGSKIWNVEQHPDIGNFVIAPDCDRSIQDALSKAALGIAATGTIDTENDSRLGKRIARGGTSWIFSALGVPNVVLKIFKHTNPREDYESFRGNIALSEGLARIDQSNLRSNYRGPEYYGAYFPSVYGGKGTTIIAMSLENGQDIATLDPAIRKRLARPQQRLSIYHRAVAAVGDDPARYHFDMDASNELVQINPAPTGDEKAITVIKFDIDVPQQTNRASVGD